MTSNNQNEPKVQLRELLDNSSGTLTAFGVFNALAGFSLSLKDQSAIIAYVLSFCFWLLSCIVWWEFIKYVYEQAGERKLSFVLIAILMLSLAVLITFGIYLFLYFEIGIRLVLGVATVAAVSPLTFGYFMAYMPKRVTDYWSSSKVSDRGRYYYLVGTMVLSVIVASGITWMTELAVRGILTLLYRANSQ